jgi:hypothetical protein
MKNKQIFKSGSFLDNNENYGEFVTGWHIASSTKENEHDENEQSSRKVEDQEDSYKHFF